MRIALLSDIHGNAIALDAVLADIERQGGVDAYWILGDLVAIGPQPAEVLERLTALPNVRFTRGNTDRYIIAGDRPPPSREDVLADPTRFAVFEEVAHTMAWTQGMVTASGWLSFLDQLPIEQRLTLPDGTRLLGVHASPGQDGGPGIRPDYAANELQARVAGCAADLLCVGHTHWPMNVQIGDTHVVNLGSVSNPQVPDLGAWYVLLEGDDAGYRVQHRSVAYDRAAVIATLQALRHPARRYIIGYMRGEYVRNWELPVKRDA